VAIINRLPSLILVPICVMLSACSTLSDGKVLNGSLTSTAINPQVSTEAPPLQTQTRATPTPRIVSTPSAASLSAEGPWLVFADGGALWATDGNVVREFFRPYYYPLSGLPKAPSFAPAPDGARLAFPAAPPNSSEYPPQQSLYFVQFPDAAPTRIADLISQEEIRKLPTQFPGDSQEPYSTPWYQGEQVRAAVSRQQSIAWSPDGKLLAVVAALDSTNTDLYVYDPLAGKMTRLTSGPYQTAGLSWSPNSRSIVHTAISDINIGRSGTDNIEGVWAADPNTKDVVSLATGDEHFLQWIGPQRALLYSWNMPCGSYNIKSVDTATGESKIMWEGSFDSAAADPETGKILVGVSIYDPDTSFTDMCGIPLRPNGLYMVRPKEEPFKLDEYSSGFYPAIIWSAEAKTFFAVTPHGIIQVTSSGQTTPTNPHLSEIPIPSPSGEYWALVDSYNGLSIASPGSPTKINIPGDVCQVIWKPDGQAIYFTDYEHLYIAEAPTFKPREIFYSDSTDLCYTNFAWVTR
jgi:hypothetical protein